MKNEYGIRMKWLTVTCFEIEYQGFRIVSDPCITDSPQNDLTWECIEGCDIITLSHGHWDHITDIPRLIGKFRPLILTPDQSALPLAQWTNYTPSRIYPMYPNTELDFGPIKIKALFGRHTDLITGFNHQVIGLAGRTAAVSDPGMNPLQAMGSLEYRNYLFTFSNGTTLLLWGNDPTQEQINMLKCIHPDIAILQYSKQAKDPEAMAKFANDIGCRIVIPHHMDLKKNRAEYLPEVIAFSEAYTKRNPEGVFIIPENGKWMQI